MNPGCRGPRREPYGPKTAMNEDGTSDGPIVPKTSANNGDGNRSNASRPAAPSAERAEGRGRRPVVLRRPRRTPAPPGLTDTGVWG